MLRHYKVDGCTRTTPTTAGSTLRRDMLSSRVVRSSETCNCLTRQALVIRLQYLGDGEADQHVVGLERRGRSPPTLYKRTIRFSS